MSTSQETLFLLTKEASGVLDEYDLNGADLEKVAKGWFGKNLGSLWRGPSGQKAAKAVGKHKKKFRKDLGSTTGKDSLSQKVKGKKRRARVTDFAFGGKKLKKRDKRSLTKEDLKVLKQDRKGEKKITKKTKKMISEYRRNVGIAAGGVGTLGLGAGIAGGYAGGKRK